MRPDLGLALTACTSTAKPRGTLTVCGSSRAAPRARPWTGARMGRPPARRGACHWPVPRTHTPHVTPKPDVDKQILRVRVAQEGEEGGRAAMA